MSRSTKKDKKSKKPINPLEYDLKIAEFKIKEEQKAKLKKLKRSEKEEIVPVIRVDPNDMEAARYEDLDVTITDIKYEGFENVKSKNPKIEIKKEDPKAKEDKVKELVSKAKQIKVKIGSKKGHPWENRINGNNCYHIGDQPGLTLNLRRDTPYIFKLDNNNIGAEMIFTTDAVGSKGAQPLKDIQSIKPGSDGLVIFGKDAPSMFYYQDKSYGFMGGIVNLK